MAAGMEFEEIAWLRASSPAWRLLRADSAPLVLSFLYRIFVEENVRSIPAAELVSRLDDELYARNERIPHSFPKPAKAYLDDWAAAESGWLRKYYREGSDEPHFDATPAVEKALQWVRVLAERDFIGTESRVNTIFDLLRQIVFGTEVDALAPDITLPVERPLYTPVRKPRLDSDPIRPAGSGDETDPTALFEQVYVDPGPLRGNVRAALRRQPQVGLADLVSAAPLTHGVAELVTYLSLRDDAFTVVYDDTRSEQVSWTGQDGRDRIATLPGVTFTRAVGLVTGARHDRA